MATPIGNLDDITLRAVRTLKEVSLIACEDTRQTAKLLNHLGISKETISCHEHNEEQKSGQILDRILSGSDVAFVSDAGMPLISDPGYRLVAKAVASGVRVVPIPGPSAPIAALPASGLPAEEFRFCGFLPPKTGARRKALDALATQDCTLIFFESPHRILEALADIEAVLGNRPAAIARELTKIHEEILRGDLSQLRQRLADRPVIKGEITLLVGGAGSVPQVVEGAADAAQLAAEFDQIMKTGVSRMEAIKAVARRHSLPKSTVYNAIQADE